MTQHLYAQDFSLNEIQNVVLQKLATDPASPASFQFWGDTTNNVAKLRIGATTYIFGSTLDKLTPPAAALSLNSQKITSLADPTLAQDGVTKNYVDLRRLDQAAVPTGPLSLNNQRITNLADPTGAQDGSTKAYVDGLLQGFAWKDDVRAASIANVAIATGLVNAAVLDGVTLATGDRVLLKNQTAGAENGIYVVVASGAASRATDADVAGDVLAMTTFVNEGTANADTAWVNTTNAPITLGTTALAFVKAYGGATSSFNKFSASIGDGTATTISVTHNLGTRDLLADVWRNSTPWDKVMPKVQLPDTNTAQVLFAPTAPAAAAYRIVLGG